MQKIYHPASSRGGAHYGWSKSKHTFNFGDYYDPKRTGFGAIKVINDDHVEGGQGFSAHSHRNMEIITIPLTGALVHQDSMGNTSTITSGDIQVMSAGTGITHSEMNANTDTPVKFLQIWVEPNTKDVTPRYQQTSLIDLLKPNTFNQVLSPNQDDAGVWIYQQAWFSVGQFSSGVSKTYHLKQNPHHHKSKHPHGVYVFVIFGSVVIDGQVMQARDGLAIQDTTDFTMDVIANAQVLVMEVAVRSDYIVTPL